MNKKPRTRFTTEKWNELSGVVYGLIDSAVRGKLSHEEYLQGRQLRLFENHNWPTLPQAWKQELLGMLRGAEKAWMAAGLIVWCHWVDNQWMTVDEFRHSGRSYSDINTDESAWIWAGVDKSRRDTTKRWI